MTRTRGTEPPVEIHAPGITLETVLDLCRLNISDDTFWPDAALTAWINAGIRLYSVHFPLRRRHLLAVETGKQAYSLPGGSDFMGLVGVEYPAENSTTAPIASKRVILRQVDYTDPQMDGGAEVYALLGLDDGTDYGIPLIQTPGVLVFAQTLADGTYAGLDYLACHPQLNSETDICTVPAVHLEAITAYADFAAHALAETAEVVGVDASSIVLSQLGEEARRTWVRYKDVMDRLTWLGTLTTGVSSSALPSWASNG